MAVNEKVSEILERQINEELFSSYLYLAIADYFEGRGLKGFANWYMIQTREELDHAMALRRYLLDNDYIPTLEAVAKPTFHFESDLAALKAGLAHEEHITECIHNCVHVAHSVRDIRAMKMLDWFVGEQGEEEANARDMVNDMELFGSDPKGLFELDREYRARTYTQLTALPL